MGTVPRAVFDTNVLISAYLWGGTPRGALETVREGRCVLVCAQAAIEEFVRVLGSRKFGFSASEIAPLVEDLTNLVIMVHPRHAVRVVTHDPTDDVFLDMAVQGRCTALVSGDKHLLALRRYRQIDIVRPGEFIRRLESI